MEIRASIHATDKPETALVRIDLADYPYRLFSYVSENLIENKSAMEKVGAILFCEMMKIYPYIGVG